jgi:hypothetical protein
MSYNPFRVHFHEQGNLGFTIAETMSGETVRGGQYTGHFPGLIRPQLDWQPLEKHH